MTAESYFDHDADTGIIGRGHSLEESFEDAARVTFALMTDLSFIAPHQSRKIEFEEEDVELALVTWLNLLIARAQADHLIFSQFRLKKNGIFWEGEASGEFWRDDFDRGMEVKGATLTMLSVKENQGEWEARCVVNI